MRLNAHNLEIGVWQRMRMVREFIRLFLSSKAAHAEGVGTRGSGIRFGAKAEKCRGSLPAMECATMSRSVGLE